MPGRRWWGAAYHSLNLCHSCHPCCSSAPESARERAVWTQPCTGRVAVSTQHCLAVTLSHQSFTCFSSPCGNDVSEAPSTPLSVICHSLPQPETDYFILCIGKGGLRRIYIYIHIFKVRKRNCMISKCLCLVSECKHLGLTPSLYWLKASPMDSSSITLYFLSRGT